MCVSEAGPGALEESDDTGIAGPSDLAYLTSERAMSKKWGDGGVSAR